MTEQRYNRRGRKLNTNPLRKVIQIIFEPMKDIHGNPLIIYGDEMQQRRELLECGHKVRVKQDIYGDTNATKRRCYKCGRGDE